MNDNREKKLLEFNPEDIKIGECKTFDTIVGMFEIYRKKKKIELYCIDTRL